MSSWIFDYVQATDPVTESPLQYTLWVAISTVGAVLKRNIWINYKDFTLYPNQYIILVGPPGVGKGTAIHPAHRYAKDAGLANYLADRIGPPRMLERLNQGFTPSIGLNPKGQVVLGAKDSTATIMSTELSILLSASDWSVDFLCDAWDRGEYAYDTKHRGSYTVKDMGVSLIGGCVTDYIRRLTKDAHTTVSSGFSARTIFVSAKEKSKSLPWGEGLRNDKTKQHLVTSLEAKLVAISKLSGEFTLDPYARLRWNEWYNELNKPDYANDSDVYKNFKARQHVHVLKVALILAASDPAVGATKLISRAILDTSIRYIDDVAETLDEIFRGVGESDVSSGMARLQVYIEKKKTASYNEIVEDNIRHIDHEGIFKILKILELIGFVVCQQQGSAQVYKYTGKPINPIRRTKP